MFDIEPVCCAPTCVPGPPLFDALLAGSAAKAADDAANISAVTAAMMAVFRIKISPFVIFVSA